MMSVRDETTSRMVPIRKQRRPTCRLIPRRDVVAGLACALLNEGLLFGAKATPSLLPINELADSCKPGDGAIVLPHNSRYAHLAQFYNKRFEHIQPQVIVYCASVQAV